MHPLWVEAGRLELRAREHVASKPPSHTQAAVREALHRRELRGRARQERGDLGEHVLPWWRQLRPRADRASGQCLEIVAEEVPVLLRLRSPDGEEVLGRDEIAVTVVAYADVEHQHARAAVAQRGRGHRASAAGPDDGYVHDI